jgi:hypothetical protein
MALPLPPFNVSVAEIMAEIANRASGFVQKLDDR